MVLALDPSGVCREFPTVEITEHGIEQSDERRRSTPGSGPELGVELGPEEVRVVDEFEQFEETGLVFSGHSGNRMEILELDDHPYFFGTQFHPEFRSRPTRASPPFVGLLEAVLDETETTEAHEEVEA